jgi:hypothetical protein
LLLGDAKYFVRHFGEILILTEDESDIAGTSESAPNHVKSDPNIRSFFVSCHVGKLGAVREIHRPVSIA